MTTKYVLEPDEEHMCYVYAHRAGIPYEEYVKDHIERCSKSVWYATTMPPI